MPTARYVLKSTSAEQRFEHVLCFNPETREFEHLLKYSSNLEPEQFWQMITLLPF